MTRSKMEEGRGCRHCEECDSNTIGSILKPIKHEVNSIDYESDFGRQGYQVFRCEMCGAYWGERYQYDAGTGSDDDWFCFGRDLDKVKRHY